MLNENEIARYHGLNESLGKARITDVRVDEKYLTVTLEDGRILSVPTDWYPRLSHGTQAERETWEIAGAGYGTYWPDLDEDISVEGLLLGRQSGEGPKSFARWLAERPIILAE